MLPLIPALLLLLLQGPSNVERLAQDGRLPEALNSIHQRLGVSSQAADLAMSSLLSMSNDASLAQALATLLAADSPETPKLVCRRISELPVAGCPLPDWASPRLTEGYEKGLRSRDGPGTRLAA